MVNGAIQHLQASVLMDMAQDGIVSQQTLASGHYQGLDLSGVRFDSVDARQAVFEDCVFTQSSWYKGQLDGARFERCSFAGSQFSVCTGPQLQMLGCDLSDSYWADNTFPSAHFATSCLDNIAASTCDLTAASLPSTLQKAWFSMCQLSNAIFNNDMTWHQVHILESEAQSWHLPQATLTQCSFIQCNLDGLQALHLQGPFLTLWKCSIRHADFSNAMLEGANFEEARLDQTKFNRSMLVRARLVRANTPGTTFIQADLSQADLSYLSASDADFTSSLLDLTNIHGAHLEQARWDNCNRNRLRLTDPVLLQAEQWKPSTR